jgi:type I restriction enzyme M protein
MNLKRGMILVTDSGTIGRVIYATSYHDAAVGTNNLIRVELSTRPCAAIYQFLRSPMGQDQ